MGKKERNERYYLSNKEKRIATNQAVRDRNRAFVRKAKEGVPCTDCGILYPSYVMDFDHIADDKFENVSDMCRRMFSLEKIHAEIEKCEIVCANCHRERTYKRSIQVRLALENAPA